MLCPKHGIPLKRLFLHTSEYCEECDKEKMPDVISLLKWDKRLQKIWHFYHATALTESVNKLEKDPTASIFVSLYRSKKDTDSSRLKSETIISVRTTRPVGEREWGMFGAAICRVYTNQDALPNARDLFGVFHGIGYNPRAVS